MEKAVSRKIPKRSLQGNVLVLRAEKVRAEKVIISNTKGVREERQQCRIHLIKDDRIISLVSMILSSVSIDD